MHYSRVGDVELPGLLKDYQNFPARLLTRDYGGRPSLEFQWVTAVRAQDAWGAQPWSPGFLDHLRVFGQKTAAISTAWVMAAAVLTTVYARVRGIDLARLVDDPAKLRALAAVAQDPAAVASPAVPTLEG